MNPEETAPSNAASSASTPSMHRRATFDNLPPSVLARIAKIAFEEDRLFKERKDGSMIFASLSLVSKKCRAAAPPFLTKEFTHKHFRSSAFRLGNMPASLLEGVSEVRLQEGRSTELVNIALALPQLEGLSKIAFTLELFGLERGSGRGSAVWSTMDADAAEAFANEIFGIEHVKICNFNDPRAFDVLDKVLNPSFAKRLEIVDGKWMSEWSFPDQSFLKLRPVFHHLDSLVLEDEGKSRSSLSCASLDAMSKGRLALPHLRFLHVSLDTPNRVPRLNSIAPGVTLLRLEIMTLRSALNPLSPPHPLFQNTVPYRILSEAKVFDEAADLFATDSTVDSPSSLRALTVFDTKFVRKNEHDAVKERAQSRGIAFESDADMDYHSRYQRPPTTPARISRRRGSYRRMCCRRCGGLSTESGGYGRAATESQFAS
ncbi:hypothetical protein JCM10296v2_004661 [Rhodotorula toruloides]